MKQITVLLDDHPGALADMSEALADKNVNIETLDGETGSTHGVVTLTVDRYDEALLALRDAGFQAFSEEALVVRLHDEPGALARHFGRFKEAGINIRSMRIIRRDAGFSLVSLVTDDNETARGLIAETVVGPSMPPPAG